MKFGLSFLPDADPASKSSLDYFDDVINLSVMADRAGLHTIKMTEHYLHPYGGYCPDPLMFLASIARKTQQIRLMTGCVLPVFHHPIQLSSRLAMLDVLSHGRLDVGFARAYLPYEFAAFGINLDESRERYDLSIQTIKQLWSEDSVTCSTPFFSFENAMIFPRPVQNPHPPIWGAAVMSRQSFAWLGEQGYNLLVTPPPGPIEQLNDRLAIYHESFWAKFRDTKHYQIAISLPLLIHENHEHALKLSDQYLNHYLKVWVDATQYWNGKTSSAYPGYEHISQVLSQLSANEMRQHNLALIGSPDYVCEKIQWMQKTLSIDHFLWQIDFGVQPYSVSSKTLELLITDVMPALGMKSYDIKQKN